MAEETTTIVVSRLQLFNFVRNSQPNLKVGSKGFCQICDEGIFNILSVEPSALRPEKVAEIQASVKHFTNHISDYWRRANYTPGNLERKKWINAPLVIYGTN